MSAPPIIRAAGLSKLFGTFTAVDDLGFEVRGGSVFAFLGANGSGKSTTIKMLIGLLAPSAGAIEVAGIDVIRTPRRVRDQIGYMGQRVSLYQGLTLRENLDFYAGLYDLGGREREQRWGDLSERFDLREFEGEQVGDLPVGIRQRAGLALSTLHRPRLLFLDEPTAGVDVQNRQRFWDLIQEEARGGVTVFVTTHFLEEVEYCDWACFIDAGRLIANAPPEAIRRLHSPGYELSVDLRDDERPAAAGALAAAGCDVSITPDGVRIRSETLDPETMRKVTSIVGCGTDGRLHVTQPEITAAFRQLMLRAAAGTAASAGDYAAEGSAAEASKIRGANAGASTSAATGTSIGASAQETAGAAGSATGGAPPSPWRRWGRLRTLMLREVRATLRDPFTLTILIAVPIAALLAFASVLSIEAHHLNLGVHDASATVASRRLVAELGATGAFTPRPFATRAALKRGLISGAISVAVVIPPDFDRGLRRAAAAAPPAIQVLYDGGETIVAGNAEAFLRAIVAVTGVTLARGEAPPARPGAADASGRPPGGIAPAPTGVEVVSHAIFNPDLNGTPFMVAGTFGFVLTFLTTLITAVSIVNERLSGTFDQLQVTPATSAEIVLGKILPLGAVFALDVVLMLVIAGLLFGVWPAGSAPFFVAVSSFYVLISLALGLIFSATSATAAAAVQKTVLFSIPLIFLGGFAFPIRNMPLPFRVIAELIPASHYIEISRAIYLRAAGPLTLAPEIGLLALFGAILIAIAFRTVEARA